MLTLEHINAVKEDAKHQDHGKAVVFSNFYHMEISQALLTERLRAAVLIGLESAIGHRGLSAYSAYWRVLTFLWILEDADFAALENYEQSPDYGFAYFKAVAEKYNVAIPAIPEAPEVAVLRSEDVAVLRIEAPVVEEEKPS